MDQQDQDDEEFEVTAEMLIHEDHDDERTLEEEELLEENNDATSELSDLQKESELPLSELLTMYGYSVSKDNSLSSSEQDTDSAKGTPKAAVKSEEKKSSSEPPNTLPEEQTTSTSTVTATTSSGSGTGTGKKPVVARPGANQSVLSRLRPVPERRSMRLFQTDAAAGDATFNSWLGSSTTEQPEDEEDDSSDDDYNDWKQEIKVGPDHQAVVPDCFSLTQPAKSSLKANLTSDLLLWSPSTSDTKITDYLSSINDILQIKEGLPGSADDRDNEQALHILCSNNYNVGQSLQQFREKMVSHQSIRPWTEAECRKFETGLRMLGKNFHALQKQYVPSRTVKELVEFYYLWKKTERFDAFAQWGKIGKKRFTLPSGLIADFMDDFLEPPDGELADMHYGTTTLNAEAKRDTSHSLLSMDDRYRAMQKTVTAKSS